MENLRLLIIAISYGIIADGLLYLFLILRKKENNYYQYISILLSLVFLFCGIHYFTSGLKLSIEAYLDLCLLVPLALGLAFFINRFKVHKYLKETETFLTTLKQDKEKELLLKNIQISSRAKLAIVYLETPLENLNIVWYTDYLKEWIDKYFKKELPTDLTGLNWYDIFPIESRWKQEHWKACKTEEIALNDCDYWEKADRYLEWTIIPLGNNKLLFSFHDITSFVKQEKALKAINQKLISLGLGE